MFGPLADACSARRLATITALLCVLAACRATSAPAGSADRARLFPPRKADFGLALWRPGFAGAAAVSDVVRIDGSRFAAVAATALRRRFELLLVVVERSPQSTSAVRIVDARQLGSPRKLPERVELSVGPPRGKRVATIAVVLGKRTRLVRWDRRRHRLVSDDS